ncbi:hypothetical protein HU200_013840 [Digitaria exilis]|uniref:Uncharacterized protein n=1 Tax=Digitaria exilis TaxID=1010633 RepID=A0A835FCF0_9POAL|nr:hypothetical protein HU200_013840 [Digitaria exilis]
MTRSKCYTPSQTTSSCHFFMEVIILLAWSIWTTRNNYIFIDQRSTLSEVGIKFNHEFSLLKHRAKKELCRPSLTNGWTA